MERLEERYINRIYPGVVVIQSVYDRNMGHIICFIFMIFAAFVKSRKKESEYRSGIIIS